MRARRSMGCRICWNIWRSRARRAATPAPSPKSIENVGGDLNAATAVENTAYYAKVLREDCGLAMEVLADILTQSLFDPQELEREKQVILQEIAALQDSPEELVFDLFNAAAFPDQPIGRADPGNAEDGEGFFARHDPGLSRPALYREKLRDRRRRGGRSRRDLRAGRSFVQEPAAATIRLSFRARNISAARCWFPRGWSRRRW